MDVSLWVEYGVPSVILAYASGGVLYFWWKTRRSNVSAYEAHDTKRLERDAQPGDHQPAGDRRGAAKEEGPPDEPVSPEALAVALRQMAKRDLIMRFGSCGNSCEFGLLQRKLGRERLELLRYADVTNVLALADAITSRFEAFAEGDALNVQASGAEWVADLPAQGLHFHTGRSTADAAEERIRTEERGKLQFLAQVFIEDLEVGEKIFVYRTLRDGRGGPDGMKGMDRLHDAMRTVGPARLLWVNEADDINPPFSVRQVRDGLYHGYMERLAPDNDPFDTNPEGWLALLKAAVELISATTLGRQGSMRDSEGDRDLMRLFALVE